MSKQLFVIRKYIYADSAEDAIKTEKRHKMSDVWIHESWLQEKINKKVHTDKGDKKLKNTGF